MQLTNIEVVHRRVQEYTGKEFDMAFTRAYSALANVVLDIEHLLATAGVLLAMRGKVEEQELSGLPKTIKVQAVDKLQVPFLEEERNLVTMARA